MPTLPDLYLTFTFDLFANAAFEHLHWGLFDGVPHEPRFLPEAQRVYAERVLAMLPAGKRVLDVGCGLGGLSRMMVEAGREVLAISPREDHIALIAAENFPGLTARCTTFEALPELPTPFDALVFAESFNFFVGQRPGQAQASLHALAERCARFTQPGSRLIFADIVTEEIDQAIRAMPGFVLVGEEDVHEHAAYSATAIQHTLTRGVWPYHQLLMGVLQLQAPALRAEVARVLDSVPNVPLREIFEGRMIETSLAKDRRYRMYALERVAGRPSDRVLEYMAPLLARVEAALGAGTPAPRHLHVGWWDTPPLKLDAASVGAAQQAMTQRFLEVAGLDQPRRVVDVGCGIGGTLLDLAERWPSADLVGINRSERQLAVARRLAASVALPVSPRFLFGDAGAIDIETASADAVLALECAFHFDSRRAFLHEAARVLRDGGRLTLTDFVPVAGAHFPSEQVDALLLGHSPWPDLAFAEGSYAQLAADAGLALRTEVDGTQNILPTFEGLALRVRAAPQGLAALPPVDRAAAALGLMLLEGRLRLLVLGFERLPR